MLKTNSSGEQLHVLRRISNGEILKRNVPQSQVATIGLDPDLEYLPIDEGTIPDFDSRIFDLLQIEGPDNTVTPRVYRIGYTAQRKEVAAILVELDNVENAKNSTHVPPARVLKTLVRSVGVLFQLAAGQTLNAKQTQVRTQFLQVAQKINDNATRRETLEAAITAGQTPDLDTGWAE